MSVEKSENLGKISVIVPAYGEDLYLDSCIESIVKQTYSDLEIILVDDGSPDRCPIICDEWAARDNRIKVIHKQNGGLVSARHAGMEASTGKYIGYVDGDDWIEPDMYAKMIDVMEREDVDIVISGFKKELFGKSIPYYNKIEEGIYRGEELRREIFPTMICDKNTLQYGLYTYVWNKLFKKEKIYPYQMKVDNRIVIGEDAACVYPAILEAESVAVIAEADYHYRQRMDSMLRRTANGVNKVSQLQTLYDYMLHSIKKCRYIDIVKPQLDYFYVSYLIMLSDCLVQEYPMIGINFPFLNLNPDSRVIIYSAGAYGLHVYKQFNESRLYEIVAWADPDYEQYVGSDYPVVSLEAALENSYDYLVIASIDIEFIESTGKRLSAYSVDMRKVISITETFDAAVKKMKDVGIISYEVLEKED